jgi:hypothetical protein
LTDKPLDREEMREIMVKNIVHNLTLWSSMNEVEQVFKNTNLSEDFDGLSVKDIVARLRQISHDTSMHEEWFPILTAWAISILPKGMVEHKVNGEIKVMIMLFRFYYEVYGDKSIKDSKPNLSFDDLSKIFMRSKSTIHEVMKDYDDFKSRLLANEQPK